MQNVLARFSINRREIHCAKMCVYVYRAEQTVLISVVGIEMDGWMDMLLLSPTEGSLQQNLNVLQKFCQTQALDINIKTPQNINIPEKNKMSGKQTQF